MTVEVVGSVFFRDDVLTLGLGPSNLCDKTPNFCLDLCSLDPVSPGFQLLLLLLQGDDLEIRGEYYKNVIRYINQRTKITYKAHVSKHIEDTSCRESF